MSKKYCKHIKEFECEYGIVGDCNKSCPFYEEADGE